MQLQQIIVEKQLCVLSLIVQETSLSGLLWMQLMLCGEPQEKVQWLDEVVQCCRRWPSARRQMLA